MCGIVGAVAQHNIVPVLLEGLRRLEYRGYDSCGVAVHTGTGLQRVRSTRRVAELAAQAAQDGVQGLTGIAHTRWATHGAPLTHNAHPHFSGPDQGAPRIALVHNGIIENHDVLRAELQAAGYAFQSQTDTEVIAHLVDHLYDGDLYAAVQQAVRRLEGAYAIAVFCAEEPHRVVGARQGSPLVVGRGADGNYLASDALALAGTTDQIMYLEDGDVVDLQLARVWVTDAQGRAVERAVHTVQVHTGEAELGPYRHFMQKEIFEQPRAVGDTLQDIDAIMPELFGDGAHAVFQSIDRVLILACGTSYYAGLTARYWIESVAGIPVNVEIASEYRYRTSVPDSRTLVVTISQSGETADTLAALKHARSLGMEQTLTICNVATSAMVRECKLAFITRAGVEIGVASTKAFTTQLTALYLLTLTLAQTRGRLDAATEEQAVKSLRHLPAAVSAVLALEPQIIAWAERFASKENALFLGRGMHYPIALEGALKLKEISYIHAEAYPAGELKHGPLALVTDAMPVITIAPHDELLEKLKSNMQEVRARGGELYVFADADSQIASAEGMHVIRMEYAIRLGMIETNPFDGVRKNRTAVPARLVQDHEIALAVEVGRKMGAPQHIVALALKTAWLCLRRSVEVRALTRDQILDEGIIWTAAKRQGGQAERKGLIEWSEELRSTVDEALAIERHSTIESWYVFGNLKGQRYTKGGWKKTLSVLMDECEKEARKRNIPFERFSLQDCRPKGVSDKLAAGASDTVDATMHTSDRMIRKTYDRRRVRVAKPVR